MKTLMIRWIMSHPVKSIMMALLVMALLLAGVQFIEMATGNDTLVETDTDVYQDNEILAENFGGESVIIVYEAEDLQSLLSVEHVEILEDFTDYAREHKDLIHSAVSPYTIIEQMVERQREELDQGLKDITGNLYNIAGESGGLEEGEGRSLEELAGNLEKFQDISDMQHEGLPAEQDTLDGLLYEDGELRDGLKEMIIDDRYMTMVLTFKGQASDAEKSDFIEGLHDRFDERAYPRLDVVISGKPVLDDDIRQSMQENIQTMLAVSAVFMVIILFIVFPVPWRLLPLGIIFTALIGTVGAMGWLGIPVTMVSMAVFPILIGLGIDYAIQFQSRYTEESVKEDKTHE